MITAAEDTEIVGIVEDAIAGPLGDGDRTRYRLERLPNAREFYVDQFDVDHVHRVLSDWAGPCRWFISREPFRQGSFSHRVRLIDIAGADQAVSA